MTDKPKPKIHEVVWQSLPSLRHPAGERSPGYYILVDGLLTMVWPDGEIATDGDSKTYTHKIEPGDADADAIARQFTGQLRKALRGDRPAGFGKGNPLKYPKGGYF